MIENDPIYSTFLNIKDHCFINGIVTDKQGNFYVLTNEISAEESTLYQGLVVIKKFNSSGNFLKIFYCANLV
ncbi:hypothetical protein G9F73_004020 [Clostridium estertheticum]|uniref:hypothetical protein n=1 Tax=Clostridium estertheticum TaxID=238834 RepID=UPI0013EEE343|nr:hypothetical protein [Clostridium estertheticum]MBZ9606998.1 hypothetical protein [Clostridium estertheticum]